MVRTVLNFSDCIITPALDPKFIINTNADTNSNYNVDANSMKNNRMWSFHSMPSATKIFGHDLADKSGGLMEGKTLFGAIIRDLPFAVDFSLECMSTDLTCGKL